jgi:hypothetical protein
VPRGTSLPGIARFYRDILGAIAGVAEDARGAHAWAVMGDGNRVLFRETDADLPPFDGHHIQITLADFSGPHRKLLERGLITEESDQHQYRFTDIVDVDTNEVLFTIEHEVRSMKHPLYARPLVNRNPAQTPRSYAPEWDAWRWALGEGWGESLCPYAAARFSLSANCLRNFATFGATTTWQYPDQGLRAK